MLITTIKNTRNPPTAIPIIAARESPLLYGYGGLGYGVGGVGVGGTILRSYTFTFEE